MPGTNIVRLRNCRRKLGKKVPQKDREDGKLTNATARVQHMERSRVSPSVSCDAFEEECVTIPRGYNFQTKFVKSDLVSSATCDIRHGSGSLSFFVL